MKNDNFNLFKGQLLGLMVLLVLGGCLPEEGKKKATCASNQAFNSVSRKCYSVDAPRSAPVPTTTSATMTEDTTASITISYTDSEADFANSCTIVSYSSTLDGNALVPPTCTCVGGVCSMTIVPDTNFNGLAQVIYQLADDDGTSASKTLGITVNAVDDAPVNTTSIPVSPALVNEDTTLNFTLNYSDVEGDLATSCQISSMSANLQTVTACSCSFLGVCTFAVAGATNYNGIGQSFQYRVFAGGQWSSYSLVFVDIAAVNDTPLLTNVNPTVTILEDHPGATGDIVLTAASDSDVATNGDVINYSISTAVSHGALSNCAGGTPDRDCFYAPTANLSNDNLKASCLFDNDIRFVAATAGTSGNAITITLTDSGAITAPTAPTVTVVGNAITIDLDDDATTGLALKSAVAASASAAALVNVVVLTSRAVNKDATGVDGDSVATAAGDCSLAGSWGSQFDTLSYQATDTLGPVTAATTGTVQISVTPQDDVPTFDVAGEAVAATEDTTSTFQLAVIHTDIDYDATFTYTADTTGLSGTLTNCMNLTGSDGVNDVTCTYVPTTNFSGATTFTYTVSDGTTTSAAITVTINVAPVNDPPTVCQYSSYQENPKCGLLGCKGSATPVSAVTPASHSASAPIYYYDSSTATCYQSTGTTSSDWTAVTNGHIKDYEVGQKQTITLKRLVIDEGGADSSEDSEEVNIAAITSSDTALIPVANVKLYYSSDSDLTTNNAGVTDAVAEASNEDTLAAVVDTSSDSYDWALVITPVIGLTGSSDITLSICDNNATVACRVLTFTVTVNAASATHNGWANVQSLGPKTNIRNQVLDQNVNCPYSRTKCSTGDPCVGSTSPIASVTPDTFNAIYLNTNGTSTDASDDTCYVAVASQTLQGLSFYPRTAQDMSITFTGGGVAGSETVTTCSATAIVVDLQSGVSTTNSVKNALTNAGCAYADVVNTSSGTTVTTMSATTISFAANKTWKSFSSYCNVTESDFVTSCSTNNMGASCMGVGTPSGVITPSKANDYYYDRANNVCYRSYGTLNTDWETYTANGQTTLTWDAFSVTGSGSITGYNIYRRLPNENYDYERPINRSTLSSSATSFSDNALNSLYAPVPKTVYFYEIHPLINGIETNPTQSFANIRVTTPPDNMAFVHRWVVNRRVCELMHKTPSSGSNFTCSFNGHGNSTTTATIFDIDNDLIVDRFEAGCPYSTSGCATTDGQCIAETAASVTAVIGNYFYERSTGTCYLGTAGPVWSQVGGSSGQLLGSNYSKAHLPPLVNLGQAQAQSYCQADFVGPFLGYNAHAGVITKDLPNRRQQLAYSQWDTSESDSNVTTLEEGLSLNSSSKCNSSGADGLTSYYSDSDIPDSSSFFTLPGTATSGILSFITGSSQTASCVSRFGIQDSIGNVGEYATDRVICSAIAGGTFNGLNTGLNGGTNAHCVGVQDLNAYGQEEIALNAVSLLDSENSFYGGTTELNYIFARNDSNSFYNRGPCNDTDSDGDCDGVIDTAWTISDETYLSNYYNIPMGLPFSINYYNDRSVTPGTTDVITQHLMEIGPTSGITSAQLHSDTVDFNTSAVFSTLDVASATGNRCGALTSGGDYNDGTGAGMWNLNILGCAIVNRAQTGFRCIGKMVDATYDE